MGTLSVRDERAVVLTAARFVPSRPATRPCRDQPDVEGHRIAHGPTEGPGPSCRPSHGVSSTVIDPWQLSFWWTGRSVREVGAAVEAQEVGPGVRRCGGTFRVVEVRTAIPAGQRPAVYEGAQRSGLGGGGCHLVEVCVL